MRFGITKILLILFLGTSEAISATFRAGDIIVSTYIGNEPDIIAFRGAIRQFRPDGVMIREVFSGDYRAGDIKFSPGGILYGAAGNAVLRFTNDGSMMSPLQAPSAVDGVQSLAFSNSGDLCATFGSVLRFGSDEALRSTIVLRPESRWADLGIDQCTLFHLRDSMISIGRFDVCNSLSLAPLPTQLGDSGVTLVRS